MVLFSRCAIALAAAALLAIYAAGIDVRRLPAPPAAVTFTGPHRRRRWAPSWPRTRRTPSRCRSIASPRFLEAIVAAEDARFHGHGAVDVRSLARAARDYAVYGRGAQRRFDHRDAARAPPPPRRPARCAASSLQIVEAERIAVRSSKDAILEAYVNRVPMGGNVYGVEAAARTYFGEPASDLDLAQASLLAAIPNDPSHLAPDGGARGAARAPALRARPHGRARRHHARAGPRRADRNAARRGATTPASPTPRTRSSFCIRASPAPAACARRIDARLQRFVQAQTQPSSPRSAALHVTDGAALVVDNRTGDVLAYVGSPDYFSDAALGRNDGVQALRQPGSSLKPFTYELALERGTIRSTTILPDVPATYAIPGGKLYQPADYSGRFSGPVRVRYALANSLNVPAVHVLSELGVGAAARPAARPRLRALEPARVLLRLGPDARQRRGHALGVGARLRDRGARRRLPFRCA